MRSDAAEPSAPVGGASDRDAVRLREVTKRFGSFVAVDRLSFHAARGEVLGFLGPNGAGKTTTLRMVMSILYPDEGDIQVLGERQAARVKDRIGYLPEERGLYRKMTVEQTLRYFGRLKGLRGAALAGRIGDALERVGLGTWRRQRVEALSKGMQQKLQFLCAILHHPELLILDEPFSGLDPLNVDLLQRLVLDLRTGGATVIFSTHQMETAERLCDRIVLIHRGRKVIEGTLEEVRGRFAARMLLLEGQGQFDPLARLPGVRSAHITSGLARLELADGVDAQTILQTAVQTARLSRFEIQRPTLQEIFVRLVGQAEGLQDDGKAAAGGPTSHAAGAD